jgi:hypothetical protein
MLEKNRLLNFSHIQIDEHAFINLDHYPDYWPG